MVLPAPGLLTTVELGTRPPFWKMRCTRRAITSGEPPGDDPTTSSTGLFGFHGCAAAGNAASTREKAKGKREKVLKFMLTPPFGCQSSVATHHCITASLHHRFSG